MEVGVVFVVIAAIIGIGFFANYFFKRTRIPDILWLIAFGIFLGPIFGIVESDMLMPYFPLFSSIALLMILFEGGSQINIYRLIKESIDMTILTTISIVLSAFSIAGLSYFILGLSPLLSLLLGVIVGGTSSPIVLPLINNLEELGQIKKKCSLVLKMESIITDPVIIIISLVLIQTVIITSPTGISGQTILTDIISLLSISVFLGFVGGVIWGSIWHKFIRYKYHYMLTIGFLFLFYVVTEFFGGSGAIASFMIGLVLGNSTQIKKMLKLDHTITGLSEETRTFNSYINFFVRTFFFALVGMMITLSRIDIFLYGVLISLVLLAVRFLAIKTATFKMKITDVDQIRMTLIYPRGLAAAVLASIPFIQYQIPGTKIFTEIVFVVIIVTVAISTIGTALFEMKVQKKE